jgi:predicted transcriptional regulator
MNEKIEVRDLRRQDWLWTAKFVLFHEKVDEKMYKVYCGLAAYADNNTQKAHPGIDTLAGKLHMSRNTVIRALQGLEENALIQIVKELGRHNIYYLLDTPKYEHKEDEPEEPKEKTPRINTLAFFKGVNDLAEKTETEESEKVREILNGICEKYSAPKALIWAEVRKFERYWTERSATGKRERWQMQETFEVDRRLVTWFSKKKEFVSKKVTVETNKGRKVEV